ncbi:hypothetical protein [Zymomonas mobilis]|uniref:hypothetical protein n=1 Tax=Zymomonas mobilis TaxID=542 RepID=UPI0021C37703|nr:hypothetical protein [Zymomonas mobilis]MCP9308660.1 hypothetical protein [Zymomonas mobilis]
MNNITMPSLKSIGTLDDKTMTVPVVFGLVDRSGEPFDYPRDVQVVLYNDNTLNQLDTVQRCFQILSGLIASCNSGALTKKQMDDYAASQVAAKAAAAAIEAKHEADAAAQAAVLKSAEESQAKYEAEQKATAANTASSDQTIVTDAQSDSIATQSTMTPSA